ncbi:hypothetical protein HMSSN036_92460 [Paenibacillus macerans]|nr:hypothetical protein HMSSN036_92460 [Paenibacillus macerans]
MLKKMWSQEAEKHDSAEEERIRSYSVEAVSDISAESERMSRLVNDMLSLARADAGQTVAKEPLMLQPVVEEVVRRAQFLPRKAEWITGNLDALAGAVVMGSKDYLQQMLFIFIEMPSNIPKRAASPSMLCAPGTKSVSALPIRESAWTAARSRIFSSASTAPTLPAA